MPDYDFKNRIKLIEILKKHTDKEHPLTQAKLRKIKGADFVMGYKNSFTRRLLEIADAYNTDENGELLDEKDWRIVYPGYIERRKNQSENGVRNGKIYYNHKISKAEMDFLIYQVRSACDFTDKEKRQLEEKLIEELASEHYKIADEKAIPQELIHYFENKEYAFISKNIQLLRSAIEDGYMVIFRMIGRNSAGEVEYCEKELYLINPYKIIYYNGDFWLLGNRLKERLYGKKYECIFTKEVNAYRIDKMGALRIAPKGFLFNSSKFKCHYPDEIKEKLELWNKQIYFSYNEEFDPAPEIAFEILWDKFPEKERNDYSFIYDTFGKNFKVKNKVVYVRTSLDFFEKWVMQYADKVVVTENTDASKIIRERIKKKTQVIGQIYKQKVL